MESSDEFSDERFMLSEEATSEIIDHGNAMDVRFVLANPVTVLDIWQDKYKHLFPEPTYDECVQILDSTWQEFYHSWLTERDELIEMFLGRFLQDKAPLDQPEPKEAKVIDLLEWRKAHDK